MPPEDVVALRRAGFVHDLGRLGISNAIWEKPAPLTQAELERVRLHPYLTDRMLAGLPALARVRRLAARNRERLDGSAYPSGLAAPDLSPADRVLAAADVYHAMTEPRAHRSAPPAATAVAELRNEAKAGRLDGEAVDAVLRAAGHRAPARREWPARLTAREVEVLGLLARGHPNREIARRLVVTPRTVATHIEHIYAKLDVSSPCRRDAVRDQARARRQLRTRLSRHRARSAERPMQRGHGRDSLRGCSPSAQQQRHQRPRAVLDAARDFSERRAVVWPNVKLRSLEVHARGENFAEVTEGTWIVGLFWERSRYEWSQPGAVTQTVIDSNVFEPGSTWEIRAMPRADGSSVELLLQRGFRRGPKGRLGSALNHTIGKWGLWSSYPRHALREIEKQAAQETMQNQQTAVQ